MRYFMICCFYTFVCQQCYQQVFRHLTGVFRNSYKPFAVCNCMVLLESLIQSRTIGERIACHRRDLSVSRCDIAQYLAGHSNWSRKSSGVDRALAKIENGMLLQRMHRMHETHRDIIRNRIIDYLAALGLCTEYDVYVLLDGIHSLYAGFRYKESDIQPYLLGMGQRKS
jgi:hypothetical protein